MTSRFAPLYHLWSEQIPLVKAMQISFHEDAQGWSLHAPLAPNRNHMNTGFGGSLAAIATLAGWAQTWMLLPEPQTAHIVIGRSEVVYSQPAKGDLIGTCDLPDTSEVNTFLERLHQRGRAGIVLTARIYSLNEEVAMLTGKFVATKK